MADIVTNEPNDGTPYETGIAFKLRDSEPANDKNWVIVQGHSESHENSMTDTEASTWTTLAAGDDIEVEAPLVNTDGVLSIAVGTGANQVAAGNHTHSQYAAVSHEHAAGDITSGTLNAARIPTLDQSKVSGLATALSDLDRVAAYVD